MLHRDHAAARALTVPSAEYHVELDFTGGDTSFRSNSTVLFDAPQGAHTWIDLVGTALRVTLNGVDVDVAAHVHDRIPLADLRPANVLTVEAECEYRTSGSAIHRFVDPETDEVFLYSQFAADDARGAFACFDQPDIKGTFQFTVTAPAHWEVLSNTRATAPQATGEARRWEFAPTVPLPTYATAVVAGPYVFEETTLTSAKGEVPARVYGRPQLRDHLAASSLFDDTQRGIDLYERIFQTEYPYDSYDQVYVPQYNFGAMENAGCVTISEDSLLFRTRASQSQLEFRSVVVLHELAHMWFGDLVTMKWWDDIWLNESFAEFVATFAASEVTDWADAWVSFGVQRKSVAYVQDQRPTTHPVLSDIPTVDDVAGSFDMITYAKGASALRQLAATLGAETFFSGVAAYIRAHHHGNATLADLFDELEEASGRDLSVWSHAWLETPGVTTLVPQLEVDAEGKVAALAVAEELPLGAVHHPHRVRVGGYSMSADGLARTWLVDADLDGARTAVDAAVGLPAPDLLLVNDEDLTYAKVHLDERSLATVAEHLPALGDATAQYLVLDALWHMCRDGALPAQRYIDAVLRALPSVVNSQVVATHCANVATAVRHFVPPADAVATGAATADSLWSLVESAPAGSDLQLTVLRAFASLASTPAHAERAASLLDGSLNLDGLPIDSELTWDLVTALAMCNAVDDAAIDQRLREDPGAAGERRAAGARAAIATTEAKRRAWDLLAHPVGDLPANALAFEIARGIGKTPDPALFAPVLDDFLASLRPTYESMDAFMAFRTVGPLFPSYLAGRVPDLDRRLEAWLEDNADAPATLRKVVTDGLDDVRRAVRAQAAA